MLGMADTEPFRMVLPGPGQPLDRQPQTPPQPSTGEVLVELIACGVCRTDLHVADGELPQARYPVVPGHEAVGRVRDVGPQVESPRIGQLVGIPWLGGTCGRCRFCLKGRENLCDRAVFTGCTRDGGYARYLLADARFVLPLPEGDPFRMAPWLCAGLIGYRALRLAGDDAGRLGLVGFGASAHLLAQLASWQGREVYAFTRPGDVAAKALAQRLGCRWAGGSDEQPPERLDAAIIFAPVGDLIPKALTWIEKGGVVVCAGIHMTDVPAFPYAWLWGERVIRSVANLTREDGEALLALAQRAKIQAEITTYPLGSANEALAALRSGRVTGAAVLDCSR